MIAGIIIGKEIYPVLFCNFYSKYKLNKNKTFFKLNIFYDIFLQNKHLEQLLILTFPI
jgi:hypothetical protein